MSVAKTAEVRKHLDPASLSVVLNIAEGNGSRAQQTRAKFFDDARGSASESAACLDALVAKRVRSSDRIRHGRDVLEIVPACREYGVGLIPWSPLAGGLLGGILEKPGNSRRAEATEQLEKHRVKLEADEALCRELGEQPNPGQSRSSRSWNNRPMARGCGP